MHFRKAFLCLVAWSVVDVNGIPRNRTRVVAEFKVAGLYLLASIENNSNSQIPGTEPQPVLQLHGHLKGLSRKLGALVNGLGKALVLIPTVQVHVVKIDRHIIARHIA